MISEYFQRGKIKFQKTTTKSGALSKHQVYIKRVEMKRTKLVYAEFDLIANCDDNLRGKFVYTLNFKDSESNSCPT